MNLKIISSTFYVALSNAERKHLARIQWLLTADAADAADADLLCVCGILMGKSPPTLERYAGNEFSNVYIIRLGAFIALEVGMIDCITYSATISNKFFHIIANMSINRSQRSTFINVFYLSIYMSL